MGLTMNDITEMIKLISATYPYAFKDISTPEDRQRVKDLWFALFQDYPRELVIKGFHEALKVEKVNIVPAAIIEQIEKIENAFGKSDQELWAEFRKTLKRANNCVYKFKFTAIEGNGKTQGENAQEELQRLYEGLSPELKRYCGNISGLKDLSQLDDESLEFEKARFLKDIGKKRAEIKMQQECPQFAQLAENAGKLLKDS